MPNKHGRTEWFIPGEGFVSPPLPSPRATMLAVASALQGPVMRPAEAKRACRFCRMLQLPQFQPNNAGLIALGQVMEDMAPPDSANSSIPAGFIYLGQFVDHDVTSDQTQGIPTGSVHPQDIIQRRSPSLDLDSLYGRGPQLSPELYEADRIRLRLGNTTGRPRFGVLDVLPNDLPRRPASAAQAPKRAIIGEPRNDANLAVAQTHVAFLKFHNKVVDHLQAKGVNPTQLFAAARQTVVQHYQSIVLHDFVRRLVDPTVYDEVLAYGRKHFLPKGVPEETSLCMPVEFSVATYGLGHSLIRNAYQWNRVFNSQGPAGFPAGLNWLSRLSAGSGDLGGEATLPTDWVVDWRRLYDFGERPGGIRHPQLNFARAIDTHLARDLQQLPECANAEQDHLKSLAVRKLLRGRLVGLPAGQDVAEAFQVTALTPAQIASGPQAAIVQAQGFDRRTPLWYYILKEAEVQQGGQRLGQVGSRIVVETFHGLIEGSSDSILWQTGWQPMLPSQHRKRFTMTDLLSFVNDVNPLGD